MTAEWERTLKARFGLESFRPWQREAVEELCDGSGRVLVIAPTGGGKSLCYQFPATVLEGTTLVVSPLIALMEDQVQALQQRGISATYLASTLAPDERRERMRRLREGEYSLVYIAPERLSHPGLIETIRRLAPPLVAIDEAHCISQWGHDFRPDYMRLGEVLEAVGAPRVLACTATATPDVRREIRERLRLGPKTKEVLRGFARPNLHLAATEVDASAGRTHIALDTLEEALGTPSSPAGAAILYAGTRRKTDELEAKVAARGWRVAGYHAGRDAEDRLRTSQAFAARELDVIVATNAFGMGIDRPDIRVVVHLQAPGSIEAYYQEVGRAGRDGRPAHGLLLLGGADIGLRRFLIESPGRDGAVPDPERVAHQWKLFLDLLRYVEAGSCRHDYILRYFGDEQETLGGCGHCDVCERLDERGGEQRVVSAEDAVIVRKALSGVARAQRRAGMKAIAEMLRGSSNKKLKRMGLDRLSTFGLFSEHNEPWVMSLLRRLISGGLVDITPSEFPMPYLTPAGVEVMKGQAPVRVLPPDAATTVSRRSRRQGRTRKRRRTPPAGMDTALYERLREMRLSLAKERGVPAYVVCHDRTLMEIAADRPSDLEAMGRVAGMGPARIAEYGAKFLAVVSER